MWVKSRHLPTRLRRRITASSPICWSATAERTTPEVEYICPAGFLCGWPVGVELVAGLPERPGSQQSHFLQAPKDVFVCSVLIYLLTYLREGSENWPSTWTYSSRCRPSDAELLPCRTPSNTRRTEFQTVPHTADTRSQTLRLPIFCLQQTWYGSLHIIGHFGHVNTGRRDGPIVIEMMS